MAHRDGDAAPAVTLVFDGECSFCSSSVDWLAKALPAMPLAVPYQRADLAGYGLTEADVESKVWLITPERRYGGADAVSALLRHQPDAVMRFLGWGMRIPPVSWVAAAGYAVVSHFRHVLPGGTPALRR